MSSEVLPVSVVIPAYRRADMVERAVRSVLAQCPAPAEVIVVDDASGDETGPRAADLGARVVTHERNQGEGGARNTGLWAAANEWVALLDSDDEWLPGHLEALWAVRDGHLAVGTAGLGRGERQEDHRIYGWAGRQPRVLRGPADVAVPENRLTSSSVMLRREAALAVGGFQPEMQRAADLDLWLRLLERGTALAVPRVTTLYHLHAGQISAEPSAMWRAHRAVLEAYEGRPWCTLRLLRRYEGALAWDTARAAAAAGAPRGATWRTLARRLARGQRLLGAAQLLAERSTGRRLASGLAPGGGPSVAILPGVAIDAGEVPGAVDLRRRNMAWGMLTLARRPTARALVGGRVAGAVVRALGVEPVRCRPGMRR